MKILEMEQKIEKNIFVFQIIAFELGVANSHNLEQDTCRRQSMCSETPLRFHLTLGETFSKSIPSQWWKTWKKLSHGDLPTIWDAFTCSLSKRVPKPRFFECGLTKIFTVCDFGNTLAMTIKFFFKMFKIWWKSKKWNKKSRKSFLFFR